MKVKLTYFKRSGKFYTEASYKTKHKSLTDIWAEVRGMSTKSRLPGLIEGAWEFIILVDVPRHPHRHPKLIVPNFGDRV